MKKDIKNIFFTVVELAILYVSSIIILIITTFIDNIINSNMSDATASFAITKIINASAILLVVFVFFKVKRRFNLLKVLKDQFLNINKKLIIFVIISIVAAIIIPLMLYLLGYMQMSWLIWNKLYLEDIIPIMIVGFLDCFLESFSEEIIYRLAAYEIIKRKLSRKWVYIFSTLIYVLIYWVGSGISLVTIINLILLNIIMMNIYIKFNNIWLSIIPRAVFEYIISYGFSMKRYGALIPGIIGFTSGSNSFINGGQYGFYGSVFTTIFFIIIIATTTYVFFYKKSE